MLIGQTHTKTDNQKRSPVLTLVIKLTITKYYIKNHYKPKKAKKTQKTKKKQKNQKTKKTKKV